ncbi:MerR family transcriptional regulator [Nocardia sp. NPDC055321]
MPPSDEPNAIPPAGQAVYAISVAAELAGIGIQTLRLYERHGLITPTRSQGGTRRYSGRDLQRLHRITDLVAQGVNLAGIARILDLQDENTALAREHDRRREQPPHS